MKNKLKAIGSAFLYTGIYVLMQVFVSFQFMSIFSIKILLSNINELYNNNIYALESLYKDLLQFTIPILIIAGIIAIVISFGIYSYFNKKPFTQLKLKKINVSYVIIAILLFIPVMGLSNFIVDMVLKIFPNGYSAYVDTIIKPMENTPILILILGVGIIAPIVEELIFRGFIFSRLRNAFSIWSAIIIQGVFFAIFHGNIIQMSYAFFIGIILGILVYKSNSLYPAIILHILNNTMSVFSDFNFDNFLYYLLPIIAIIMVVLIIFDKQIVNVYKSKSI